jgi:hypothetical protein
LGYVHELLWDASFDACFKFLLGRSRCNLLTVSVV